MLYSFGAAEAEERHDLQYFEMFGNRGIYHQGWTAVSSRAVYSGGGGFDAIHALTPAE